MENTSANKTKGIYIAVLNQGSIRPELSMFLTDLTHQGKYNLCIKYPAQKPISFNRNQLVKDFLSKPEYDYLLMLDGDIIPPLNVLDLALYDKDIAGGLCFGFLPGSLLVPFIMKENENGRYNVMELEGTEGMVKCDAIGSGCMMIKREVLEKVKYPFRNEYDEDGIKTKGLDFNFCTRAKEKGFETWCNVNMPCSHWTEMDLKDIYRWITEAQTQKLVEDGGIKIKDQKT